MMTKRENKLSAQDIETIVAEVLACLPSAQGIYIYGSMARGDGRSDSDLDIAVVQMTPPDAKHILMLRSRLGLLFGRDIDVLDLRRSSTEIAYQVIGDGECVWGADDESVALYENSVMSMYADLQIERAGIIEDILKRRSIYGK